MVGLIGIPLAILSLMLEYACVMVVMEIVEGEYCDVGSLGRALIHVFSNPSATEGYLSWGYLSKKLELFAPY